MSENWERGDLALCVQNKAQWEDIDTGMFEGGPDIGQCFVVADVGVHESGMVGLNFPQWPDDYYDCEGFIKVTPPKDMVLDEEETLIPA